MYAMNSHQTFEKIPHWINQIGKIITIFIWNDFYSERKASKDVSLLLVGTKSDLTSDVSDQEIEVKK